MEQIGKQNEHRNREKNLKNLQITFIKFFWVGYNLLATVLALYVLEKQVSNHT